MLKTLIAGLIVCVLCMILGFQPHRGVAQSLCNTDEITPTPEPPVQGVRIAFIAGSKTYNSLNVVKAAR